MRVTRILHVSLNTASAPEKTAVFYDRVLGLAGADRPDIPGVPGSWFQVERGQLHLVGAECRGEGIDPVGPHFCLGVEDLGEAVRELEERGIAYVKAGEGEAAQVWINDPTGHTVELQQDPQGTTVRRGGAAAG